MVIPAAGKLRQKHHKQARLGYIARSRLAWATQPGPVSENKITVL